jgi:hypothetical protein
VGRPWTSLRGPEGSGWSTVDATGPLCGSQSPPRRLRGGWAAAGVTAAGNVNKVGEGMFRPVIPLLERAAAEPDAPDPIQMAHCLRRIAELFDDLAGERREGNQADRDAGSGDAR